MPESETRLESSKLKVVCGNCAKKRYFDSWEEAFIVGWDTVDRFGYTACDECLGISVYFPMLLSQEARPLMGKETEAYKIRLAEIAELSLVFDVEGYANQAQAYEVWKKEKDEAPQPAS